MKNNVQLLQGKKRLQTNLNFASCHFTPLLALLSIFPLIICRHQMKTVADYDAKPSRNPPTKPLVMTMFCFTNSVVYKQKRKKNVYNMILQIITHHRHTGQDSGKNVCQQ